MQLRRQFTKICNMHYEESIYEMGKLLIKIDYECSFNSSCPRNMEQFGNAGKSARPVLKFQSLF